MNPQTQDNLPGAGCVAAGFVFAWLAMRLWNLLNPKVGRDSVEPSLRVTDKTTAAAGMMAAAAHSLQDRLRDADFGGVPLSQDELIQLERGRAHLETAMKALAPHAERAYFFEESDHSNAPTLHILNLRPSNTPTERP